VTLQEVVFEIRFTPIEDYAIFAGAMAVSHKGKFPITEKNNLPGLPDSVIMKGLVRHRFFNQDKSRLFQIGSDVISVNHLQYTSFVDFTKDISEILPSAQENGAKIRNIDRIGLRYINKFNDIKNPFTFLNLSSPFPSEGLDITKFVQIRKVDEIETGLFLDIGLQFESNTSVLILDLNSFYQKQEDTKQPSQEWNIEMLIDWISKAHTLIYDKFITLVPQSE